MTDHDPTPDPEVLAALRAWATATDPSADPIVGPTIRAGTPGWARWARHRALLVAAAVLVVLVAGATVWAVRDDDAGQVTTDPEPTVVPDAAVPLDIVVQTIGIEGDTPATTRSITIDRDCRDDDPTCTEPWPEGGRPIIAGTSVVLSDQVPDGSTWLVTVRSWDCGDVACALDADGSPPGDEDPEPQVCVTSFPVDGPTLATIGLAGAVDRPECGASTGGPVPALTVPPAFTLRDPYPWDCGSGVDAVGGSDGDTDDRSWDCLAGALSDDEASELVVHEPRARGVTARSWWRASEDERLVIFREPRSSGGPAGTAELDRWTVQHCDSLLEATTGPPGVLLPVACDEQTELDLVYEGPEARAPVPGAVFAPLDLFVTSGDAGDPDPTTADRWVLSEEGTPVASGPLDAGAALVGALDLPRTGRVTIRWDTHDCAVTCPPTDPGGIPLGDETPFETRCEEEVPTDAERVFVRFQSVDSAPGGAMCGVVAGIGIPPLTVPPAWSLRDRYTSSCGADAGADGPTPGPSGCLVQAFEAGESVEMESTEGDERRIVWRVGPGLTITRPPTASQPAWTEQFCTSLALVTPAAPPYLDPQGCGAEVPLSFDPPP